MKIYICLALMSLCALQSVFGMEEATIRKSKPINQLIIDDSDSENGGDKQESPSHKKARLEPQPQVTSFPSQLDKDMFINSLMAEQNSEATRGLMKNNLMVAENSEAARILIKQWIERGWPIDATNQNGFTALMATAAKGFLSAFQFACDKGANIQAQSTAGFTPLILAAGYGCLEIVEYLLSQCVDVNSKTTQDITALIGAAEKGHIAIVKVLCQAGAIVNFKSKSGLTPLIVAAQNGHLSVVECLYENGADIDSKTNEGFTALQCASMRKQQKVVDFLTRKYQRLGIRVPVFKVPQPPRPSLDMNRNASPAQPTPPGVPKPVAVLVPKPSAPSTNQQALVVPPLLPIQPSQVMVSKPVANEAHEPVERVLVPSTLESCTEVQASAEITEGNASQVLTQLIECAKKKAIQSSDGSLLEQLAVERKAAIRSLITKALATKKDSLLEKLLPLTGAAMLQEMNLLILAINGDALAIAKMLLTKGISIDAQNKKGQTPLMVATEKANTNRDFINLIRLLHRANAKGDIRDNEGNIFLDYASPELLEELPRWTREFDPFMKGKPS